MYGIILSALTSFLGRLLIGFGVAVVSYAGISAGVSQLISMIQENFSALPQDALIALTLLKIPQALNIILSASVAKLAVSSAKKVVLK